MITGTILSLIGIAIAIPTATLLLYEEEDCHIKQCSVDYSLLVPACVGLVMYQFGLGLFEANAIQFGTDQLQFASNDKLSVFVNWYFWSLYTTNIIYPFIPFRGISVAILGVFSCISISIMLFCCCGCHSHFTTEPVGNHKMLC